MHVWLFTVAAPKHAVGVAARLLCCWWSWGYGADGHCMPWVGLGCQTPESFSPKALARPALPTILYRFFVLVLRTLRSSPLSLSVLSLGPGAKQVETVWNPGSVLYPCPSFVVSADLTSILSAPSSTSFIKMTPGPQNPHYSSRSSGLQMPGRKRDLKVGQLKS